MVRQWRLIPFVLCVATAGCITGFTHPLGPAGQARIDERLIGVWNCISANDDESPGDLTFLKFDASQYYVRTGDRESPPQDLRGLATLLGESSFLSLRVIGPKPDDEWTIVRYTLTDERHLTL